jgi:hypothetical protein
MDDDKDWYVFVCYANLTSLETCCSKVQFRKCDHLARGSSTRPLARPLLRFLGDDFRSHEFMDSLCNSPRRPILKSNR